MLRDIILTILLIIGVAAAFYAMWVLVAVFVGLVIYALLRFKRRFKWKLSPY